MTFQEMTPEAFEKLFVVASPRQLSNFFPPRILPLRELLLQNGAIKFLFGIEVPKDDGFIHLSMGCQIPSRSTAKSISRKHLDCRFDDLLPLARFVHK